MKYHKSKCNKIYT